MINKISIKGPASYKNMAIFETDKNINLIYGLNGSGKSTLSEFLRKRTDNEYAECSISPLLDEDAEEILVYNENYVNDVFYSSDTQKGIFSLSKENAGARKRIDAANAALQVANRDFQKQELLQEKELEVIGINIKYNFYQQFASFYSKYNLVKIANLSENKEARTIGTVKRVRETKTKNNETMAFVEITDDTSNIEIVLFPMIYQQIGKLQNGMILMISGKTQKRMTLQIIVDRFKIIS